MFSSLGRRALLAIALTAVASAALGQPFPLGGEFPVVTSGSNGFADVAYDSSGNFVVVWQRGGTFGGDIHGQRFDASGNPRGGEFQVNTYTTSAQRYPSVASDAPGNFVVAWESLDQDGDREGIFGRRFDSGGSPLGGEFRINTATAGGQTQARLAADGAGGFIAVWRGQDGSSAGIFGQLYDASGARVGTEFRVNTFTPFGQRNPSVSVDADGDFVVAWQDLRRGYPEGDIFARRFAASGIPLGDQFRVNPEAVGRNRSPDVASFEEGGFLVVWHKHVVAAGGPRQVSARRYDAAGGPVGSEFEVVALSYNNIVEPRAAVARDESFVVAWEHPVGALEPEIFARQFDPDANPITDPFQVNTYTTDFHLDPALASMPDGDFVVIWNDNQRGLFGRRYAGPGLHLEADGTCPGTVTASLINAPPNSEVAIVAAANTNGFTKGGQICSGVGFEIGEPFQLPPTFVIVDGEGAGSAQLTLGVDRCHLQALALASCETSDVVVVPSLD